jgi:hypothetical protein
MMQVDVIISDKVVKAEDIFGGQLGDVERLQEALGETHSDSSAVKATIARARDLLTGLGAALDQVEGVLAG